MANSLEEMHAQITQSHLLVKEVETCCRRRMSLKPAFCASHFKRTLCKWKCSFSPSEPCRVQWRVGRTPRLHRELIINASGETGVSDF